MKQLFFSLLAITVLFSCKDDSENQNTERTASEKLMNRWDLVHIIDFNYVGATTTLDETDTIISGSGYLDFRADGKVYGEILGSKDTMEYSLKNDTKLTFDGDEFEITKLTETDLVFKYYERTDTPYYDNVVTLKR